MKKLFSIFLILSLSISAFSGCGNKEVDTDITSENILTEREQSIIDDSIESDDISHEEPTPTLENKIEVEWKEISYTDTDTDGYKYKITYSISPWILLSNTNALNAAWEKIKGQYQLPSFNDWGLEKYGNGYIRNNVARGGATSRFSSAMTDMYYCMGTIKIENLTEGWDISNSNERKVPYYLFWKCNHKHEYSDMACTICRTFASNTTDDQSNGFHYSFAIMNKNTWGPVPFIFMAPENFSPKFPNGEYANEMLNGSFYYIDDNGDTPEFSVGVIDKDGTYTPPIK